MTYNPWLVIGCCLLVSVAIKGLGPALFGGRELPKQMGNVIALTAPALLAALLITQAFSHEGHFQISPLTGGVLAGTAAALARQSVLVTIIIAAAVTAILRI